MIDATFVDELIRTPMGQALLEQRAERERTRRVELIARRRELRRERERIGVKHAKAVATCQQTRDAAARKLREAADALLTAERTMTAATAPIDTELTRIDRELAATVDARITAAIDRLNTVDRGEWVICDVGRDGLGHQTAKTNGAAVRRLTDAHALALATLRGLVFESPSDMDAAIAAALRPYREAEAARGMLDGEPQRNAPKRRPGPVFGLPSLARTS
jgi:hypothetical protein